MAQATAVTIISRVSSEVGIPVAADPFSSQDPNQALLIRLLNGAGRELMNVYQWPELDQILEFDFAASAGAGSFLVPDDFGYIHNQTIWNTTEGKTVLGPMSAQDWYALQNDTVNGVNTGEMYFRRVGPAIQFLPDPSPVTTIVTLEYTSSYWVEDAAGTTKPEVTANDDVVLLDDLLVSRLVKVRWLEAKAMATSAAAIEFRTVLDDAIAKARGGGKVLTVTGTVGSIYPNLPSTGFGS